MTSNTDYILQVEQAAGFVRRRFGSFPQVAVLTGTGLGDLAADLEKAAGLPYKEIPNFPAPTVASHAGVLLKGRLGTRQVAVCQGRFHLYEGYSPRQVTFSVRVLAALGVKYLILTNAAGGLAPGFAAGDLMLIRDHVNLTGANPLTGPNIDAWGLRFPDMTAAYDPVLRQAAQEAAAAAGLGLQSGVYAGLHGPSLETPAEMRFLRIIGADAVGFSTVMETIAAVHAGIRVLGISTITNIADPDDPRPADVESIIAVARQAAPALARVVAGVLERI